MPSACSVSGNIQDLTGTGQAGFAVFFLENYSTNIPRVIGTTNLCSKQVTLAANSSGVISGTIWGNDNIDPAGTFYSLAIQDQGRNLIAYYAFNITGGSFNLNSATPITTAPVVASPTGDTTYLRLDGGNSSSATDPFSFAKQLLLTRLTNQIVTGSAGNQTTLHFPASASNITLTFPITADTVVGRATTDTLTNKTLTSPIISAGSFSGNQTGVTLTGASSGNAVSLLAPFQSAAAASTGNSADKTYYTYTLPANALQAGKGIRFTAVSKHTTGTASVLFRLSFGGTSTTAFGLGAASNAEVRCVYEIFNNPGVTNAQSMCSYATCNNPATGVAFFDTAAIDTTSSVTVNATFNVAGTDQITPQAFWGELIQ